MNERRKMKRRSGYEFSGQQSPDHKEQITQGITKSNKWMKKIGGGGRLATDGRVQGRYCSVYLEDKFLACLLPLFPIKDPRRWGKG